MWNWMRTGDGGPLMSTHAVVMWIGFAVLLGAGWFLHQGSARAFWPVASVEVFSVDIKCEMRGQRFRRADEVIQLPCDQVAEFRKNNAGGRWSASQKYLGEVRVTRNGEHVSVVIPLPAQSLGKPPRPGDVFDMRQNPGVPTDVILMEQGLTEILIGASLGGLAFFTLLVGLVWF